VHGHRHGRGGIATPDDDNDAQCGLSMAGRECSRAMADIVRIAGDEETGGGGGGGGDVARRGLRIDLGRGFVVRRRAGRDDDRHRPPTAQAAFAQQLVKK
jgi:hypothetical protein